MSVAPLPIRRRLDRIGVALSSLCAVHCLLGLVLVSMLGLGGEILLDPSIHRIGLAVAVAIGAVTLSLGAWHHRRKGPLLLGSGGLVLMAGGLMVQHGLAEALLTVPGVALVAAAHILNLRHAA